MTSHPDVVIVSGGSGVVRSVTDGGLTWRLDPDAGNADLLAPGKVMFVTGRGVGRVVDARRDDRVLAVTIGPVDITDVIQDGEFTSEQPVSLTEAAAYQFDDTFWVSPSTEARSEPAASATPGRTPAVTGNALTRTGLGRAPPPRRPPRARWTSRVSAARTGSAPASPTVTVGSASPAPSPS